MNLKQLLTDERAISPVVGVALLIAIAVILATVIGAVVLQIGPGGADAPQANLDANYSISNDSIELSHAGGDPLPAGEVKFVDESGGTVNLSEVTNGELSTGETVGLFMLSGENAAALESGDTITVIWSAPDSQKESVIAEFDP